MARQLMVIMVLVTAIGAAPARAERVSPPACDIRDWHRWQAVDVTDGGPAIEVGTHIAWLPNFDGAGAGQVVGAGPLTSTVGRGILDGVLVGWRWNGTTLDESPAWRQYGTLGEVLGRSVSSGGDINGDGFTDLVAGAGATLNPRAPHAWYGGSGAPHAVPNWSLPPALFGATQAFTARGVGDVNGDGFDDVAVIAREWRAFPFESRIYVFHGSATGLSDVPGSILPSTTGLWEGVQGAGDVDGDSYDDVLGMMQYDTATGRSGVVLFVGSPTGAIATPRQVIVAPDALHRFGLGLAKAGDLDRDGFDDVLIGDPGDPYTTNPHGRAYMYRGSPSGLVLAWTHEGSGIELRMGRNACAPGDVDGDGWDDVVIAGYLAPFGPAGGWDGVLEVFFGSPTGLGSEPELIHVAERDARQSGDSLAAPGDLNGDGLADLLAGSRTSTHLTGGVQVLLGRRRNHPPVLAAPSDIVIDCGAVGLHVDSTDVDGDALAFTWTSDCADVTFAPSGDVPDPVATFDPSCGRSCTIGVVADDARCGFADTAFRVRVEDRTAPVVTAGRADLQTVWPPNGKIVTFGAADVAPEVRDACDATPAWWIAGCFAEEDGAALPVGECGVSDDGTSVWVRARRAGTARDGRRYGVLVAARDACGNECAPALVGFVHVPHDRR